jgi:hypothetical protein
VGASGGKPPGATRPLEISALGNIDLESGTLSSSGETPDSDVPVGAGAGSGGGILLASPGTITLNGTVNASGTAGGNGLLIGGGGGGGGRILLEASNTIIPDPSLISVAGGAGGTSNTTSANNGIDGGTGTFDVTSYVPAVPEPGIGSSLLIGLGAILTRRRAV